MVDQQKMSRRPSRRHSTKKRISFHPPAHPGRIIAILAAAVAVIVLALVWGNILKRQSDAYRANEEEGQWTLPPAETTDKSASVPDVHLLEILPEGNVGDIIIENSHDGVLLPLRDGTGSLHYLSNTAAEAGLSLPDDAISLADDVARVSRRGLYVTGIFHLTCFEVDDLATQTYRRGLELALLREYAASGIDALLILGLPAGDDAKDALSVSFLEELNTLLSSLADPPAVGAALSLSAFAGETDEDGQIQYVGEISPSRVAKAADFLALDLRSMTAADIDAVLPRLSYAYTRHALWMLTDREFEDIAENLLSHGFGRICEMQKDS